MKGHQAADSGHFETRHSKRGTPFQLWVSDMPRIDDSYINCVVYLYPSEAAAEDGERIGGSGFLVGAPVCNADRIVTTSFLCLVTNRHVAENGNTIARVNGRDGKTEIISLDNEKWIYHPGGDDLAVCPIGLAATYPFKYMEVGAFNFLTEKSVSGLDIGIGDEVFSLGRFVNREGKQVNTPAIRFGNIAQMPIEPIIQENGFKQDSFLVEVRTLSGYSGSPVFVYIPAQADLDKYTEESKRNIIAQSPLLRWKRQNMSIPFGPLLLGVAYAYIYSKNPVFNEHTGKPSPDWYVNANTGMMAVVPAWKLAELVLGEEMSKIIDEVERKLFKASSGVGLASATSDESAPPATGENPTHLEDFTRLVGAAARKHELKD